MSAQLTAAEQAYLQGLAQYEAALNTESAAAEAGYAASGMSGGEEEAAYLQGQIDYELALIAQMEQQAMPASLEEAYACGLQDYEAAVMSQEAPGDLSPEEAYMLGVMECEAAMEAGEQEIPPELKKESSYQLGVTHAEVAQLDAMLKEEAGRLEAEDREIYEQGRKDYQAALDREKSSAAGDMATESPARPERSEKKRSRES